MGWLALCAVMVVGRLSYVDLDVTTARSMELEAEAEMALEEECDDTSLAKRRAGALQWTVADDIPTTEEKAMHMLDWMPARLQAYADEFNVAMLIRLPDRRALRRLKEMVESGGSSKSSTGQTIPLSILRPSIMPRGLDVLGLPSNWGPMSGLFPLDPFFGPAVEFLTEPYPDPLEIIVDDRMADVDDISADVRYHCLAFGLVKGKTCYGHYFQKQRKFHDVNKLPQVNLGATILSVNVVLDTIPGLPENTKICDCNICGANFICVKDKSSDILWPLVKRSTVVLKDLLKGKENEEAWYGVADGKGIGHTGNYIDPVPSDFDIPTAVEVTHARKSKKQLGVFCVEKATGFVFWKNTTDPKERLIPIVVHAYLNDAQDEADILGTGPLITDGLHMWLSAFQTSEEPEAKAVTGGKIMATPEQYGMVDKKNLDRNINLWLTGSEEITLFSSPQEASSSGSIPTVLYVVVPKTVEHVIKTGIWRADKRNMKARRLDAPEEKLDPAREMAILLKKLRAASFVIKGELPTEIPNE